MSRSVIGLISLALVILSANCMSLSATSTDFVLQNPSPLTTEPSATPTLLMTPIPPDTLTATMTITSIPSPANTLIPSLTLPPTGRPSVAPTLPPIGVSFVTHGSREKPYVALTFDMCQKPDNPAWFDEGILNALVEYNAPATFFLGGDWMRTHPDETRILANNPTFDLGNHSWSHPDLRDLDEEDISEEIIKTQDMLYQLTGKQTRLFRLPSGFYNEFALSVVAWHGLYTIQWDVVTADPVPDNTAENILKIVQDRVQNGSIIIMHANGRGWHTAEALPLIIEYLRGQGYILVTISQLIGLESLP